MGDSKFPGDKAGGKKASVAPARSAKAKPFIPLATIPTEAAPKTAPAKIALKPSIVAETATAALTTPVKKAAPAAKPVAVPTASAPPAKVVAPGASAKPALAEAKAAAPVAQKTPVAAPAAVVPVAAPIPVAAPKVEPAVLASAAPEITTPETDPVATLPSAPAQSRGTIEMATTFDAPTTPAAVTEKAKAMFGGLNDRAKTAMEKSTKMGEEISELTKGNVEALVASGKVAAKGAETMAQDAAEYSKKSFETMTSMFKSMAAVKSPTELFQLQSEFAKSSFDSAVAEASKLSEAWVKLAGEVVQPISNRYAVASEKLKAAAL